MQPRPLSGRVSHSTSATQITAIDFLESSFRDFVIFFFFKFDFKSWFILSTLKEEVEI